ncbi:MAG TPA: riboflavin synthase [Verrucomicrobiales bacterium]|nr:riboflavin synthase [Verrucomicrobiales bacterium]
MFTGIIEETGIVAGIRETANSIRLSIDAVRTARGLAVGDSLAVNGCCLTLVRRARKGSGMRLQFDLLRETWERTNLQFAKPGALVNLERSMSANGRFGGHFVTGHIDGMGQIVKWSRQGKDHILEIAAPADILRYVVFKGSVAVDGISLTVAKVLKGRFRLWIIPHTYEVTALRERAVCDHVNLEGDLIGKYVEKFSRRGG